MKTPFLKRKTEIADNFVLNTIVSVDELLEHDMIYIYHHLRVGATVNLKACGMNVKGDLRFEVWYKNFLLGYATIGGPVKDLYQGVETLESEIVSMEKRKFLPIKALDISLQATKMRMVS